MFLLMNFIYICSLLGFGSDCLGENNSIPAHIPPAILGLLLQSPTPVQNYPAKKLPAKFISATAFTSGSYGTPSQRLEFVTSVAVKAKSRGLQAINLVVDWCDIEPTQGGIEFDLLEDMVFAIKSRGLYCILRIYANTEGHWQAWPKWLEKGLDPSATYNVAVEDKGGMEIFPWASSYQIAWESFQERMASKFISSVVQPDAIQITLGGSFGEQVLGKYDSTSWVWPKFTDTLFKSEKWHVDSYMRTLGSVAQSHIVMVNSLVPTMPEYEDEVCQHAYDKDATWVQSNAGACFLKGKDYGDASAKMLARAYGRGTNIFLEDESGNWSCGTVGLSESLSSRVEYMKQLQKTYGFLFSAVSVNNTDIDDVSGLSDLKSMLGL
jgi:hypothetical protein